MSPPSSDPSADTKASSDQIDSTNAGCTEQGTSRDARPAVNGSPVNKTRAGRVRRFVYKTALTALVIYALIIGALVLLETRLVYPGAYVTTTPLTNGIRTEQVEYTSSDGNRLKGRLLKRKDCTNYILFMHGNFSKAQRLERWAERLSTAFDATVLLAEYRGYEDDLTPTEAGLIIDCKAARSYLCETFGTKNSDIILYGRSLGGGCAAALAAEGGAKALVLERTYDELVGVACRQYPWIPVRLIMRNQFDSMSKINRYPGPTIIIHGTSDDLIPIECARRLHQSSQSEHKLLIEVPGLGHNGSLPKQSLQQTVKAVASFSSNQQ